METGEVGATEGEPDAVEVVLGQHEHVRALFSRLDTAGSQDRQETFDELLRLLAVHETAEEEVIYPALRRIAGGEDIANARTAEEHSAKKALSDLERIGVEGEGFDRRLLEFRDMVLSHADCEEQEALPLLRANLEPERLRQMATAFLTAEAMAPTHPHPHAPESAAGNLLTGPFLAMVDRVRDALRGVTKGRS